MIRIATAGLAVLGLTACGAKENPGVVARSKALIEHEAATIWRVAHPTALKYELKFDDHVWTPEGYQLNYTFAPERGFITSLRFHFDPDGSLKGIDPERVIEVIKDTATVKAFFGADVAIGALRQDLKSRIEKLPTDKREELKGLLDDKLSAKGVAGAWLKFREQRPTD